jgi:hypothetical protein
MKVFRDKTTGELFVLKEDNTLWSLHNNCECILPNLDLEEIPTKDSEYNIERIVNSKCYTKELQKYDFTLKDIIYIPVDNKEIPFRVEHITDKKVYLVSLNIIDILLIEWVNHFLNDFLDKLPKDLVNILAEIEHKQNGELVRKSKVTLLSRGNLVEKDKYDGEDDIVFDGFKDKKGRKKESKDKDFYSWWTDSARKNDSQNYFFVDYKGYSSNSFDMDAYNGVCPCIAISRK